MLMVTVGQVADTPVVENDKIVVHRVSNVTLSLDHRYTDGARAVVIYQRFVKFLNDPEKSIADDIVAAQEKHKEDSKFEKAAAK